MNCKKAVNMLIIIQKKQAVIFSYFSAKIDSLENIVLKKEISSVIG